MLALLHNHPLSARERAERQAKRSLSQAKSICDETVKSAAIVLAVHAPAHTHTHTIKSFSSSNAEVERKTITHAEKKGSANLSKFVHANWKPKMDDDGRVYSFALR